VSIAAKSFSLFKRDIFLFVSNLLTGIVVARMLGPASMGIWVILCMIPSYAETFGRMKFDIAAVYLLGKGKYRIGEVVYTINLLAILSSLLIIIPIVWNIDWIYSILFDKGGPDVKYLIYYVLPQIPLYFLYMNYSYLFIYKEDTKTYNRMVIIQSLVSSLGAIILLLVFKLGLLSVIITSATSILISLIYGVSKFGTVKEANVLNIKLIKEMFSYVYKLYISGIIGYLNTYVTNLIVALYLVPAKVAFFSMAQGRGQILSKIPNALNTMLLPKISKMSSGEKPEELAATAFRVSLMLLVLAAMLAYILVKPLVLILYGRAYLPMVIPLWIILPGLVLSAASTTLSQYFQGTGRVDIDAKISFFPMCTQVVMAYVLIPRFGLAGASCAFLTGLVSDAILRIFFFLRLSGLNCKKHMFIGKSDIKIVSVFLKSVISKPFTKKSERESS